MQCWDQIEIAQMLHQMDWDTSNINPMLVESAPNLIDKPLIYKRIHVNTDWRKVKVPFIQNTINGIQ